MPLGLEHCARHGALFGRRWSDGRECRFFFDSFHLAGGLGGAAQCRSHRLGHLWTRLPRKFARATCGRRGRYWRGFRFERRVRNHGLIMIVIKNRVGILIVQIDVLASKRRWPEPKASVCSPAWLEQRACESQLARPLLPGAAGLEGGAAGLIADVWAAVVAGAAAFGGSVPLRRSPRATRSVPFACSTLMGFGQNQVRADAECFCNSSLPLNDRDCQ